MFQIHAHQWDEVIERKIRYDAGVVEYTCQFLDSQEQQLVLFHKIEDTFSMIAGQNKLTIPKGSYTTAYYWEDRPYNLYFWRDHQGNYLGSYFNIVKNTCIQEQMVIFEDLMIDLLVFPNGDYFILDEDELPEALECFENGSVYNALYVLIDSLESILSQVKSDAEGVYHHATFVPLLVDK
ncbi:DUF402 domain-containing protein [Bacillus sp. Bos-x628]|uniref:DUF402 domain-containing protein n=1 Tax=Bacillus maqinnsis TaxID=3229854 RepID=UPI00338D97E4